EAESMPAPLHATILLMISVLSCGSQPRVYPVEMGSRPMSFDAQRIAISPDGHWLAASAISKSEMGVRINEISVFDVQSGMVHAAWKSAKPAHCLAFTPDSKYLAVGTCTRADEFAPRPSDGEVYFVGTVVFHELATGKQSNLHFKGHNGCVMSL